MGSSRQGSEKERLFDAPIAFFKVTLTDPRGVPEMVSGSRRVLRLPNCEVAYQLLNSVVTSSVSVDPDALQPETEPQLN